MAKQVNLTVTGTITDDGQQPPPGGTTPPPDVTPPPVTGPPPGPGQSTLEVGPNRAVAEPADAAPLLATGGTMILDDGVYKKAFHVENDGLTIKSASGNPYKCYFDGQGGMGGGHRLAWGKGMVHSNRSITVIGVGFRNCGSPASGDAYGNEAGLWVGDTGGVVPVTATAQRCAFDHNGDGLFAPHENNIKFVVTECLFGYLQPNGWNSSAGAGGASPAHDMYLAAGEVEVTKCMFWGCCNGHNVKSRSPKTNVHDNPCMTQDGGRVLDACEGGAVTFNNNVVYTRTDRANQDPQMCFGNANMIGYAGENANQGIPGMNMSGNTLHVSRTNSVIWANSGKITSKQDTVKYYESGSLTLQGNVAGLSGGSAPPGSPPAPSLPIPPDWAKP